LSEQGTVKAYVQRDRKGSTHTYSHSTRLSRIPLDK
jgi:hypothetical protein